MSNIKELIRAEIERRKKENMYVDPPMSIGKYYEDRALLFFLDTLPDELVTECHDLEEAAEEYTTTHLRNNEFPTADSAFKAGAEWQKKQIPMPEDTVIFQKGVEEGKRMMMEGATYNELMELYRAIRDELVKRHRDVPINIKEEQ